MRTRKIRGMHLMPRSKEWKVDDTTAVMSFRNLTLGQDYFCDVGQPVPNQSCLTWALIRNYNLCCHRRGRMCRPVPWTHSSLTSESRI